MTIPFVFALAGGSFIFLGVMIVGFFVFAFSYYTRRGSGINQHPYGDIDHNSGPERPSELHHHHPGHPQLGSRRRWAPPQPSLIG